MMVELFVPGRLCLPGEHTDWAAGYPSLDGASFNVGEAIVTGIDQGLHARVSLLSPHDHDDVRFIFRSSSSPDLSLDVPIGSAADQVALLSIAVSGSPASYVAGCVHHLLSSGTARISNTAGVLIDNHTTTMPMQKGLSSSAAVCVLVVRAFNVLLDLGLSAEQEMELAYHGERTTPSQCGRLDQAGCAFGSRPVRLTFDAQAQLAAVVPIPLRCDLFFVIVDLGAHKDTRTILSDLNACFQSPAPTAVQLAVRAYLGHVSPSITVKAIEAMERGDPVALGALLTSAQAHFDTVRATTINIILIFN